MVNEDKDMVLEMDVVMMAASKFPLSRVEKEINLTPKL
jgi:hypothetical protein